MQTHDNGESSEFCLRACCFVFRRILKSAVKAQHSQIRHDIFVCICKMTHFTFIIDLIFLKHFFFCNARITHTIAFGFVVSE